MNDEQISQDSWNKYPTVVDLFHTAPRNWRTMLTLAAAFLLKLLKLQVKWVHQQKRRTIVFRKRAKNFQPLLVKFGWVIHKFGLIKTRSQNTRNWTNYFAHCSHFSSPLRGLEILLRKCFNLVVFSSLLCFLIHGYMSWRSYNYYLFRDKLRYHLRYLQCFLFLYILLCSKVFSTP